MKGNIRPKDPVKMGTYTNVRDFCLDMQKQTNNESWMEIYDIRERQRTQFIKQLQFMGVKLDIQHRFCVEFYAYTMNQVTAYSRPCPHDLPRGMHIEQVFDRVVTKMMRGE